MPCDVDRLEVRELFWKIDAFEDAKIEKLYWLRWQTAHIMNAQIAQWSKDRIEPEQLIPLSTDKKQKKSKLTDEQIRKRLEKWDDPGRVIKKEIITPDKAKQLFNIKQ